jgi:hypothetical protein
MEMRQDESEAILAVERGFWTHADEPEYFREHMAEGGLSAIEPVGVIDKATAATMTSPSPWTDVTFEDVVVRRITPDLVVLAYHGSGRNPEMDHPYRGAIASAYVRVGDAWRLALTAHQPWDPDRTKG